MTRHEHFMSIALDQAGAALAAGDFPVGCVLCYRDEIVATGHRHHTTGRVNELDHAEMVALRSLFDSDRQLDMAELTVYATMEPCLMCFSALVVNGVRRIVYSYEDAMGGGTTLPLAAVAPLYSQLRMEVTGGILRSRSLDLFKRFFSNPANSYLKNSLLASYTLKQ